MSRLVSDVLMAALAIDDREARCAYLVDNPVPLVRNGSVHRIGGFDPRAAVWITFCGLPYGGNAYVEEVLDGLPDCMACVAGR